MKIFTKRLALVMGLLFTVLICMGIVYIDNTKHYWQFSGGFVRLVVNTNAQATMTVDTNTLSIGLNTNNTARSFVAAGRKPATNTTGNGTSAVNSGAIVLVGGDGGETLATTTASSGSGGTATVQGGAGGLGPVLTITNSTGGPGGGLTLGGGNGGDVIGGVASNNVTGGSGGVVTTSGGGGGNPSVAATNAVGGGGGAVSFSGGGGGAPTAGWSRKGGVGGAINFSAGNGGDGVRTNGGNGGTVTITGGTAGAATTSPGNPGNGGQVLITGGNGNTGPTTNSNGGDVIISGGSSPIGAVTGDVILGQNGAVKIGTIGSGIAALTNVLAAFASLDFPNTAAGTINDIPIPMTGATSNNCAVSLSVPWQSTFGNGGIFSTFNSNDAIYVRFANNNLVTAIDPPPGTFTVVVFRIR